MNKIPVFLHIPKNAGTYVLSVTEKIFRFHCIKKGWNNKLDWSLSLRKFHVVDSEQKQYATLFVHDPNSNRDINNKIKKHNERPHVNLVDINDVEIVLEDFQNKKFELFSVIIEPRGVKLITKSFFQNICEKTNKIPLYYTIFRKPYERALSLYNYIKSEDSVHEPTHNIIHADTFEEYLRSHQLEESWIIRSLACVRDGATISEEDFKTVCNILKNFKIVDITKTDNLIDEVFMECYGVTRDIIKDHKNINKNATQKVINKSFDNLNDELKQLFLERTKFDNRLYDYFIK
jgi:hypothetical protein